MLFVVLCCGVGACICCVVVVMVGVVFCFLIISFCPILMPCIAYGLSARRVSMLTLYIFEMLYSVCFASTVCMWFVCWVVSGVLFVIGISILSPALMLVVRFGFAW